MSSSERRRGRLIVISGPSGTGKTSICESLLRRDADAVWSISATTRPPRGNEKSGSSYEYISREEFEARRERDEFLEWAEYVGHLYGTPAKPAFEAMDAGRNVVMEIDVQGGAQVAKRVPASVRIFVLPPTMDSLKARLEGRHTESAEQLAKRLAEADGEIGFARDSGCYRHFVVNDVLEDTVAEIEGIIRSETENADR
ncbi:MAG TPA: guanylate kinase [Phycisphaerae bacterium]|nr:guanylate kinase [Phycisphaerae bacterium]